MIKFIIVIILQAANSSTNVTYEASFSSQEKCEEHITKVSEEAEKAGMHGSMLLYCVGKYND